MVLCCPLSGLANKELQLPLRLIMYVLFQNFESLVVFSRSRKQSEFILFKIFNFCLHFVILPSVFTELAQFVDTLHQYSTRLSNKKICQGQEQSKLNLAPVFRSYNLGFYSLVIEMCIM